jgi:hypothetical protein
MKTSTASRAPPWHLPLACVLCLLLITATGISRAGTPDADAVAAMSAKYASLEHALRQNQFRRPLVLDSVETPNKLQGEVYAIVAFPMRTVTEALSHPAHWCEVMILHINTKYCHAVTDPAGTALVVNIGKKTPEELSDTARVEFRYHLSAATPNYAKVILDAKDGPLGTSNYRILVELTPLAAGRTFMHLVYSYDMNLAARLAMRAYLGTIGNDKVGFTQAGTQADGSADHIAGVRGLAERNTMRYFLAIDSYLASVGMSGAAGLDHRLQRWFDATEQYPRQLHEIDRADYLTMKHAEYLRQQTAR